MLEWTPCNYGGRESGFAARFRVVADVWPYSTGTAFTPVVSVTSSLREPARSTVQQSIKPSSSYC
jgi:hypothetical protein